MTPERTWEMYGAEREEVSESWQHTYDLSSTMIPNVSAAMDIKEHFCKHILYKEIPDSRYGRVTLLSSGRMIQSIRRFTDDDLPYRCCVSRFFSE